MFSCRKGASQRICTLSNQQSRALTVPGPHRDIKNLLMWYELLLWPPEHERNHTGEDPDEVRWWREDEGAGSLSHCSGLMRVPE